MSIESCATMRLVEARNDGRLGDREAASLDRHVATCAACRAHSADLPRLRELASEPTSPQTPLQQQRSRARLLYEAARIDEPRHAAPSATPSAPAAPTSTPRLGQASTPTPTQSAAATPAEPVAIATPAPEPPKVDPGATDFADAVHLFERGDYPSAARHLADFSKAHPEDGRAEDAAFRGILSLQRTGKTAEAAAAAQRYLQAYPAGYRRAEAARIAEKR